MLQNGQRKDMVTMEFKMICKEEDFPGAISNIYDVKISWLKQSEISVTIGSIEDIYDGVIYLLTDDADELVEIKYEEIISIEVL